MRRGHPFWEESESTATFEQLFAPRPEDVQGLQRAIGADLRQWYAEVAREPIPDDWLLLLQQNDNSEVERVKDTGASDATGMT